MRTEQTLRYCARVTVEAAAPLSIASGKADGVFDTALARDANGLPVLPGTALAGVLRAAWREHFGEDPAHLFGKSAAQHDDAAISRVSVSWGRIHDGAGQPVDALVHDRARLAADPLLGPLLANDLPHRDHVALDHRGSARDQGKFDRTYVPVGHRFTFDISLAAAPDAACSDDWENLLALLGSPGFRLGGATRRGYGKLKVITLAAACFDLAKADDRARYARLPARLDQHASELQVRALPELSSAAGWEPICIELVPEDFWRAGSGKQSFSGQTKTPDALPYSERRVDWDGRGHPRPPKAAQIVLPGSSIKGALAHRVAFHYWRLAGIFADAPGRQDADRNRCPGVEALFGSIKEDGQGHAGHIIIDDLRFSPEPGDVIAMQHNSIDRFTGGTRDGVLYAEELVARRPLTLHISVSQRAFAQLSENERPLVRGALAAALDDLCAGRLALGAAQAKGHGFFTGRLANAPAWLQGEAR